MEDRINLKLHHEYQKGSTDTGSAAILQVPRPGAYRLSPLSQRRGLGYRQQLQENTQNLARLWLALLD
jgi:hypothetical protein